MTSRRERLHRLRTGFQCHASWEEMAGDERRRHCAACRRDVLDLAQLSPREIAAHLEASRGDLCGRVTRRGERLMMAPAVEPVTPAARGPQRRTPAFAATLIGAWLAASSAGAEAEAAPPAAVADGHETAGRAPLPRPSAAPGGAALRGRFHDAADAALPGAIVVVRNTLGGTAYEAITHTDGSFSFDELPIGTYELEATLEGFDVVVYPNLMLRAGVRVDVDITGLPTSDNVTMGVMVMAAEPMRRLFADSDVVVVAVAGPSALIGRESYVGNAKTELRVEDILKGPAELKRISYHHSEYPDDNDGEIDAAGELVPGTRVLAFLDRSEEESSDRRAPVYEAVDFRSVRVLGQAELDAYVRRLAALRRIEARADRRGEGDAEELVEWLVATAEDPLTRGEATGEIVAALDALDEHAEAASLTPAQAAADLRELLDRFHDEGGRLQAEPQQSLLGAFIGHEQRERLVAALGATTGLRESDFALFELVRRWDRAAALAWLGTQLDAASVPDERAGDLQYQLQALVEELGDAKLQAIVDGVEGREQEVEALWEDDETEETQALREERLRGLWADMRHELAAALAVPH